MREGHAAILQLLLEDSRSDPASSRCLEIAVKNDYSQLVLILLLDRRVDPTQYCLMEDIDSDSARILLGDDRMKMQLVC